MKLPLSWISKYVEIKEGPNKLAEDLSFSGTKVESIEKAADDFIFDFEITPNRPDCLSVIGLAREIAALYRRTLKLPQVFFETPKTLVGNKSVELEVIEKSLCPYYSLGIIDSIKVASSPSWLTSRLEKSGIRSINNIVDITNYVMLETGQPMHAFDYNKVKGKMILRASKEGELVTTLDDVERKLPKGAIIIEDNEKLIDLAGLMGGQVSEIDENSQTVILHAPLYDPLAIRRASQALGLRTEASNRFEKRLDPASHRFAFERAAELFSTVAGGELVSRIKSVGYPPPERKIEVPASLISNTLGIPLTTDEICDYLSRLEFSTSLSNGVLIAVLPSFRTDITQPIDLTEEVGRLYGYNKFPKTLPAGQPPMTNTSSEDFELGLKQIFANLGLQEIYTNTLTSAVILEDLGIKSENCLKVANRLVVDHEYLRPTLLIGLLQAGALNIVNSDSFSFFEAGRVFEKKRKEYGLPAQPKKIAALFVNSNFSITKDVLDAVFKKLNIGDKVNFSREKILSPFATDSAKVFVGENIVGTIGRIEAQVLSKFDISVPTFGFELNLEALEKLSREPRYQPIPKFPSVKERISLFLPDNLNFADTLSAVKRGAGKNCYQSELLEDVQIEGKRSVLIGIEYYASDHTLKKEEVGIIREKVFEELKEAGAQPRVKKT